MEKLNVGASMRWLVIYSWKTDYFTSDFIKQCKQNPNVPQDISKDTQFIIKHSHEGGLYSQVVRIYHYIQKTKDTKEPFAEEEDHNNNKNEH